jgi:hypothetical protein
MSKGGTQQNNNFDMCRLRFRLSQTLPAIGTWYKVVAYHVLEVLRP